jgi:hypothetical protein
MMPQLAIAATTMVLAACSMAQPPADSPPQHGGTPEHQCDPSNIQQFVGKRRSADVEQRMMQVSGAAIVRWVPPGTAITMEFRSDRLTVYLDSSNRVERISCS